jgi:hypothetical protein
MCSINPDRGCARNRNRVIRHEEENGCERRSAEQERDREEGFALIAALMAVWVLTALGILVFTVTTQDVRISSRTVGEKKAFSAAESGISWLAENFDPGTLSASAVSNRVVDPNNPGLIDTRSTFSISPPAVPTSGPATLITPGYSIGGGEVWGQTLYVATVNGRNANYNSSIDVQVGLGYGPVDLTTVYR